MAQQFWMPLHCGKLLHPAEQCSLQESGVASVIDPYGVRIRAEDCARARRVKGLDLGKANAADHHHGFSGDDGDMAVDVGVVKAERPCWMLTPRALEHRQPNCTLSPENLAVHRTMLNRFVSIAAGSAASSHLQHGLQHASHSVLFYGDSLMWDLFQVARCEVLRSSNTSRQVKQLAYLSVYAANRLKVSRSVNINQHQAVLNDTINRFSAHGGGTIIASIGMHFNNFHAARTGFVEAFDVGVRPQLEGHLLKLVDVLESYAQRGHNHAAVLLTPTLQHFETWDGSFAPSIINATGYGCRQGPAEDTLRNTSSANHWRSADMVRIAQARGPHVLIVPQHRISHHWWDQHPGGQGLAKTTSRGLMAKSTLDCTHFCYGPFLYEPIWWALRELWNGLKPAAA